MQTQEENGIVGIYVTICETDKEEVDRCNGWTVATEELALVALPPLTTPTTNSTLSEGSSNVISASGRSKCEKLFSVPSCLICMGVSLLCSIHPGLKVAN